LNIDNKLCDANRNKLVFVNSINTSASNSSYLDLDPNADKGPDIKLEKWILTAIKLRICKNNVLFAERIVKRSAKKAQVFKEGWVVTLAILKKLRCFTKLKRLLVRILGIN
jgi:hypothetical protein